MRDGWLRFSVYEGMWAIYRLLHFPVPDCGCWKVVQVGSVHGRGVSGYNGKQ